MSGFSPEDVRALLAIAVEEEEERYTLVEPIGEGGMGVVHAEWDGQILREVARKSLRPEARDQRERFLREARITAQLEHPNVVAVYDIDEGIEPSFTMRRIRGESLAEVMDRGTLPSLGARLDIFKKTCSAVAYAHDCGVVHRDLKPSNVMVGGFGEVQVVDWGLAVVAGESELHRGDDEVVTGAMDRTQFGAILGTPLFMAPEQTAGLTVDERTDVYGLGRLLACLLAGRVVKPSVSVDAPWELLAVVGRATASAPEDRYARVLDLLADIEAFQDRLPLPSLHYGLIRRALKGLSRHRRIAAASGATGLFVGGALAAVVFFQSVQHVAAIGSARDVALAAEARAEEELAGAQLALTWSAAARDDLPAARAHVARAREIHGERGVEEALATAWLDWRFGRPLWFHADPKSRSLRYTGEGWIAFVSDADTFRLDPDGRASMLWEGDYVTWSSLGPVRWREGVLERLNGEGEVRWSLPWPGQAPVIHAVGSVVAAGADGLGASVMDVESGRVLWHSEQIEYVLGVSGNGERLLGAAVAVTRHRTPSEVLLEDRTGSVLSLPPHLISRISEDGTLVGSVEGTEIRLRTVDGSRSRVVPAAGAISLFWAGGRMHAWAPPHLISVDLDTAPVYTVLPEAPHQVRADGERVLVAHPQEGFSEWSVGPQGTPQLGVGGITDLAVSPDGELLAAVGWDGVLEVIDTMTRTVLLRRVLDPTGLRAVDWSEDGTALVVGARSGEAMVLDAITGKVSWRSPGREAIAMDVSFVGSEVLVGWESGEVIRYDLEGSEAQVGGNGSLWALLPGPPLVMSGRGDHDPVFTVAGNQAKAPANAAYGLDRVGTTVAVGTAGGAVVGSTEGDDFQLLPSVAVVDVAFLDSDTLLAATYDGEIAVWRRGESAWTAAEPLPIADRALSSIEVADDVIWVGDGAGRAFDLHLFEGGTATLRDLLRRGHSDILGAAETEGLDTVRKAYVLGDLEAAAAAAGSESSPAGRLWAVFLGLR